MHPYLLRVAGLPVDYFTIHGLKGLENISRAYSFRLAVTTDKSAGEDVERVALGQRAQLTFHAEEHVRAFHGVIAAIRLSDRISQGRTHYRIQFVPRLWLLHRKRRTRIFQDMRVSDVVSKVLLEEGIAARWQLARTYPIRSYCTQYEETDYAFITRILAEAGIYFYFASGGPVDGTLASASAMAGAIGTTGAAAATHFGSAALGGAVGSAASAASPIIPGDTVICADDALFYPPIGADDSVSLLASTTASMVPEAAVAVGDASAGAGLLIGAASAQAAPPLHYLEALDTGVSRIDKIDRFELKTSVRATGAVFRDYDPERPLTKLESVALSVAPFPESTLQTLATVAAQAGAAVGASVAGVAGSVGSAVAGTAGAAASVASGALGEPAPPYLEVYDHHGSFLFPSWTVASDEAPRMLRQERRRAVVARGRSGCSDLCAGHKFALVGHPTARLDQEYAVTRVEHRGELDPRGRRGDETARRPVYENTFECVPVTMAYVPPQPVRRSVQVTLTAVVVGPGEEEIYVDAMGRIKVQFHWDRDGRHDERSSCWIRTMQPWGGAGWGAQFIPRVGMEVAVTFEGGDPDKPIVIGCLYNATHPSPFALPASKTRSGWRTQSTPRGKGNNELSFEDAIGQEQIYVHAQKNLDEMVEHNHTLHVRNDERIRIEGSRHDRVEKDFEEHVLGDHNSVVDGRRVAVVRGDEDRRVTGASLTRIEERERRDVQGPSDLVYAQDRTVRVLGCSTTIVGTSDKKRSWTTLAEGVAALSGVDRLELSSETEVVLSVGDSTIRITKSGIELSAPSISTVGEAGKCKVDKDGLSMQSNGAKMNMGDTLVMKSPTSSVVVGKALQLDGPQILLNSPGRAKDAPPKEPGPPTKVVLSDQDGNPVTYQRFVVELADGTELSGRTDDAGEAELQLESNGKIVFLDLAMDGEPAQGDLQPHVVRAGDYLGRLAFTRGFDADKVWNDAKNAELRAKRKDPNVLQPGDVLYFPRAPRDGKALQQGTTNQYKATVPKTTVEVQFDDSRLYNAKYVVEGLGARPTGTTDGNGGMSLDVPVHVREVQVVFLEKNVSCTVRIGDLDPIDEPSGYRRRLEHLGYRRRWRGEAEPEAEAEDRRAITAFQRATGLNVTGELDAATKRALEEAHGS